MGLFIYDKVAYKSFQDACKTLNQSVTHVLYLKRTYKLDSTQALNMALYGSEEFGLKFKDKIYNNFADACRKLNLNYNKSYQFMRYRSLTELEVLELIHEDEKFKNKQLT